MKPLATLELNKQRKPVFRAVCPSHGKTLKNGQFKGQVSSDFRGVTYEGLQFWCKGNAEHSSHPFSASYPKNAPKTPEEVAAWTEKELLRLATTPSKSLT